MIRHPLVLRRLVVTATVLLAAAAWNAGTGEAHKAITSKYHFNEDIFPVVRDRCGRCHVDGGVAPMSLMTFDDAAPWAESLRLELLSDATPEWHPLKLSARETDLLLVWATGGAPRGSVDKAPPPVTLINEWGSGAPDVVVPMREAFTLPGATTDATHDVVLPLAGSSGRVLAAIDLLPGTPAIVRSAVLQLKAADGTTKTLATWLPGRGTSVPLPAAVRVSEGASIVARISYKRTWKYEGQDLSDKSAVGLYFAGTAKKTTATPAPAPRR